MFHTRSLAASAVFAAAAAFAPAAQATTTNLIGESTFSGSVSASYTPAGIVLALGLAWDIGTPLGVAHHVLHAEGDLDARALFTLSFLGQQEIDLLPIFGLPASPASGDVAQDLGVFAFDPLLSIPEVETALDLLTAVIESGSGSGSDFFDLTDLGFSAPIEAGGSYEFGPGSTLTSGSVSATAFVNENASGDLAAAFDALLEDILGITLPVSVSFDSVSVSASGTATLKSYSLSEIPLPAGAALLPLGIGALVVLRRRKPA